MQDMILMKQGEIVLKGMNRHSFEQRLLTNTVKALQPYGDFKVYATQSTVYAEPKSESCDMDGAFEAAQKVFGYMSLSRASACEKDKDAIFERCVSYLGDAMRSARSFKVETKRADKRFPMTSIQLSQYVGGLLADAFPETEVDVHHPELTVTIEVRDFAAYIHGPEVLGAGGMPMGSNGRAISLLSGGIDSPVSTWMAAKRGLRIHPLHFYAFPYTSELAKKKVLDLAGLLTPWCGPLKVEIVPFTHIQEEIRDKCDEAYFTLIMRRFMMRIADKVADRHGCSCLITGENLGQVASQTVEAMAVTQAVTQKPILKPLICLDKREITKLAYDLGTFDTSILPYEDCCTVFTPRHPRTHPTLAEVEEQEKRLDVEALVTEAVDGIWREEATKL